MWVQNTTEERISPKLQIKWNGSYKIIAKPSLSNFSLQDLNKINLMLLRMLIDLIKSFYPKDDLIEAFVSQEEKEMKMSNQKEQVERRTIRLKP